MFICGEFGVGGLSWASCQISESEVLFEFAINKRVSSQRFKLLIDLL